MDIKTLNKLAKACRKLGIAHLKTDEIEIHLSPEIVSAPKRTPRTLAPVNESLFSEPDAQTQQKAALTDMDLLFWSTNNLGEHSQ